MAAAAAGGGSGREQEAAGATGAHHLEWRQFSVCGSRFNLPSYYSVIKPIGQGAYGIVCSATDVRTGRNVAIKKITDAFAHATDTKRTLREAQLLRLISHENVIAIVDILPPVNVAEFDDVYVISELMDTDLHQIIQSRQPLTTDHLQYFVYQMLRGLKYIHSLDVVHRDLKPSNLLLNGNCDLKICDFGLARPLGPAQDHSTFLTEYVATRWYRAPEVLLKWCRYTKALDMWSIGCILAELLGRRAIFPGKDYKHQIQLICDKLGTPSQEDLEGVTSDRARQYLTSMPVRARVDMRQVYPNASPCAIALLDRLLVFNPDTRYTVEQALESEFMASLHNADDEPRATTPLSLDSRLDAPASNPDNRLTTHELKRLMYNECRDHYHQYLAPWPYPADPADPANPATAAAAPIADARAGAAPSAGGGDVSMQ